MENSLVADKHIPSSIGHGWHYGNGVMIPTLMTQSAAPDMLLQLIRCGCTISQCTMSCKCATGHLPCTDACACAGGTGCKNPHKFDYHELDSSVSDSNEVDDR
jgi:hypothetical protein